MQYQIWINGKQAFTLDCRVSDDRGDVDEDVPNISAAAIVDSKLSEQQVEFALAGLGQAVDYVTAKDPAPTDHDAWRRDFRAGKSW